MGYFLVFRGKGPSWDHSKRRREQEDWVDHATFMDGLVEDGFVVMGGPIGDGEGEDTLQVVEAESVEAVRERINDDPWGEDMLTTKSVQPWQVWLRRDLHRHERRPMVPEAKLKQHEGGLAPEGEGWFVVNAREARWFDHDVFGRFTRFEGDGDARFSEVGINVSLLEPGKASCMYHGENAQEDFLVLRGECLLLIEGEERPLRAWDFVHCPPWAEHVFVGAGSEPCLILAVGTRKDPEEIVYRAAPVTEPYDAGVRETTPDPEEAYARFSRSVERPYREGDLPDC